MKKLILSSLLSVCSLVGLAQVQDVMVIEKSDKTQVKLNVDDISRIVFESMVIKVITGESTNITEDGATISGTVEGTVSTITVGIIYGTSRTLSETNGIKESTLSDGKFSINLSRLDSEKTYYYCAYAEVKGTFYYGEIKSFTTKKATTGTLNGHDWVDLGLPSGIKWATCNVGASTPTETGDYYAWGETYTKSVYDSDNYSYYNSKVISSNISGSIYDVAQMKWNGKWRMPTLKEMTELRDKCSFTWTTIDGVKGAKLTGPNGNSIFLPAGGAIGPIYLDGSTVKNVGIYGNYWSATLAYRENGLESNYLYFNSSKIITYSFDIFNNYNAININSYNGMLIRPVCN